MTPPVARLIQRSARGLAKDIEDQDAAIDDDLSRHQHRPVRGRDRLQRQQGRQQRQVEQHGLGIAGADGDAGEEQAQALARHRRGGRRRRRRRPQPPSQIQQIAGAEIFQRHEQGVERLCQHGEAEHGRGEPQDIAEQQAEAEGRRA
jgi:hypothetical protein